MNEFRKKLLKVGVPKGTYTINDSWGIKDIYRLLRKEHKIKETYPQFQAIIKAMHKAMADALVEGKEIIFPHRMGGIILKKTERIYKTSWKPLPVDWEATLQLWEEDKECFEKRQLIFHDEKTYFKFSYNKKRACFKNKLFYLFRVVREVKRRIKQEIKDGKIDAFNLRERYD